MHIPWITDLPQSNEKKLWDENCFVCFLAFHPPQISTRLQRDILFKIEECTGTEQARRKEQVQTRATPLVTSILFTMPLLEIATHCWHEYGHISLGHNPQSLFFRFLFFALRIANLSTCCIERTIFISSISAIRRSAWPSQITTVYTPLSCHLRISRFIFLVTRIRHPEFSQTFVLDKPAILVKRLCSS